ncbi:hypothetical protein [Streptomyces sp. RG80]|uniref:hypothetical protein n=1 Tax=Streptomyces sp. RG80 TaxID=3157340 RepID=UPI00338D6DE8
MGYDLHAVIAEDAALRRAARDVPVARIAALGQGLALMPMTGALPDAVAQGGGERALGFWRLSQGWVKQLAAWSAGGPVAYVEAEYFGGTGEQRAVVWEGGGVVLGPVHVGEGQRFSSLGSPVSQALRRLGASVGSAVDEFEAVGLDRHRNDDAWIR